jgi:hypothetical protein
MKRFVGCDERVELCPNVDLSTLTVAKRTREDQDHVDQPPDSESADRDELKNPSADLSDIEPMRAEDADEEAEEGGGQDALVGLERGACGLHSAAILHGAAVDAHHGLGVHRATAGAAEHC